MDKFITYFFLGVLGFGLIVAFALLFAVITMFAWNNSVHELFGLPLIGFMQAFWLNLLSGMLLKSANFNTKA